MLQNLSCNKKHDCRFVGRFCADFVWPKMSFCDIFVHFLLGNWIDLDEAWQTDGGRERFKFRTFIHIPPLTGKPEQQRFTVRSGVLTSISGRQRSAVSGRPLPEQTVFGPAFCSETDPLLPQPASLWLLPHNVLQQRLTNTISSEYYQVLIAYAFNHPGGMEG